MRIALRLWIALLVTVVLVLGTGVLIRATQERRLLLEVTMRDRRFFAHILEAALSRQHGNPDPLREAQGMLKRQEIVDAHIEARLVSLTHDQKLPRPRLSEALVGPVAHGKVVVGALEDELLTYVPLDTAGVALELSEPHAVTELVARISWWSLWTQTLALIALAGLVTLVIVRWLVGKPLGRLAMLARQIGGGDLSARDARSRSSTASAWLRSSSCATPIACAPWASWRRRSRTSWARRSMWSRATRA